MNYNDFDKKRITVPIPEYDISIEKRRKEPLSCFIDRNRVPKHRVAFPKFDYEDFCEQLKRKKKQN